MTRWSGWDVHGRRLGRHLRDRAVHPVGAGGTRRRFPLHAPRRRRPPGFRPPKLLSEVHRGGEAGADRGTKDQNQAGTATDLVPPLPSGGRDGAGGVALRSLSTCWGSMTRQTPPTRTSSSSTPSTPMSISPRWPIDAVPSGPSATNWWEAVRPPIRELPVIWLYMRWTRKGRPTDDTRGPRTPMVPRCGNATRRPGDSGTGGSTPVGCRTPPDPGLALVGQPPRRTTEHRTRRCHRRMPPT